MNFGEKLKMLRKEKNLSGKQVADGLGIGLRTYRYYEKNACMPRTRKKLEQLANFFGKPADYFLLENASASVRLLREEYAMEQRQYCKQQALFAEPIIKELNSFFLVLSGKHLWLI